MHNKLIKDAKGDGSSWLAAGLEKKETRHYALTVMHLEGYQFPERRCLERGGGKAENHIKQMKSKRRGRQRAGEMKRKKEIFKNSLVFGFKNKKRL